KILLAGLCILVFVLIIWGIIYLKKDEENKGEVYRGGIGLIIAGVILFLLSSGMAIVTEGCKT
ncbi:MAG: hypothetical protein Harvfovirus76_6, partial [Harvfovirus sp.]